MAEKTKVLKQPPKLVVACCMDLGGKVKDMVEGWTGGWFPE